MIGLRVKIRQQRPDHLGCRRSQPVALSLVSAHVLNHVLINSRPAIKLLDQRREIQHFQKSRRQIFGTFGRVKVGAGPSASASET